MTLNLHPKVQGAINGGALSLIVLYVLQTYVPHFDPPAAVAGAITTLFAGIFGYASPNDSPSGQTAPPKVSA